MIENLSLGAVAFTAGVIAGRVYPRLWGFARKVYWHRKRGICWRYKSTGCLENRDGTVSYFCSRCGHPFGYH